VFFYGGAVLTSFAVLNDIQQGKDGLALFDGLTFAAGAAVFARTSLLSTGLTNSGEAVETVTVYRALGKNGETIYVGITNSFARRFAEHMAEKGIQIEEIEGLTNLTRETARAVEQTLIEFYGLGKNGGSLLNRINSISPNNPIYAEALQTGAAILKNAGFPGF